MASIAISLYDEQQTREECYSCGEIGKGSGFVDVSGQKRLLECRMFTELGNAVETRLSAEETTLFESNLIDIVEIGVDSGKVTFGKKFAFKTQSRGAGGLSKYECGEDYQIPRLIKHEKLAHTEMLYVHYEGCPKKAISTELQDMVYVNDEYSDSYNVDNMLSDAFIMAARETVAEQVEYCDIIGVFGGANEKANAYDGILAQAYWAYTTLAYFHSVQFTIDETIFEDGTFLHAKYSGAQSTIDIELDSTQASDPSVNRYATRAEAYAAIVNWLNDDVRTESDRKYVDATYFGNEIVVTSKWSETTVNLNMFVDANPTVESWADCSVYTGVTPVTLQGVMPIDERPHLVKFQRYTEDNILKELPKDIYLAVRDIDQTLKPRGAEWALYIDSYVWNKYLFAFQNKGAEENANDLRNQFNVYTLPALSDHGGTGIWFITCESPNTRLRNIAHLVDTVRQDMNDIQIRLSDDCRKMRLFYEVLHGVMVKDFRLFASNLLCSPFVKTFEGKEIWEKTLPMLPCWNRKVRDSFIEPSKYDNDCRIRAQFEETDQYQNEALYAIPTASGTPDIRVLEQGETLPNGALPVFEIQLTDKTKGISPNQVTEVEYEYTVQTSDGLELVYTDKNPIIQYIGTAAGTAFNVIQKVSIPSINCEDTYIASEALEEDFPFEMRGACNDVEIKLEGRIDKTNDYVLDFVGETADTSVEITLVAGGTDTIDLSSNTNPADVEAAAAIINDYLTTNGYAGVAVGDNATLLVTVTSSVDVIFDSVEGDTANVVRQHRLTVVDSTIWDSADGIAALELFVKCQGQPDPVDPTFTELPDLDLIDSCVGAGWTLTANVNSNLGCSFDGLTVDVATIVDPAQDASFELTNV